MAYHFNGSNVPPGKRDEWRTPPALIDFLTDRYYITFDLAASKENAIVPNYFTRQDDALMQDWSQTTDHRPDGPWNFCNPPFSVKEQFILKAIDQLVEREVRTVMILPLSPETGWFMNNLLDKSFPFLRNFNDRPRFPIKVLSPRVAYADEDGNIMNQPPFVTCLVEFIASEYGDPEVRWLKWR